MGKNKLINMRATLENIDFAIASAEQHFDQIIQLQKGNHQQHLTSEQQVQSGFLFAEHTIEVLKKMASKMPQVIAIRDGEVIGYNLAMDVSMQNDLPMLTPMFRQFEKSIYNGKPLTDYAFMVGGQVCVDERFRGLGILNHLYQHTKMLVRNRFQLCVTEISSRNTVSLKSHQKMGFQLTDSYHDGKELWNIVVWNFEIEKIISMKFNPIKPNHGKIIDT